MGRPVLDIGSRILKYAPRDPNTGCWVWHGALDHHGYGIIGVSYRNRYAHRVSWQHFVGPIPDGLDLDHLCRNKRCCNPFHLDPVTTGENTLRCIAAIGHPNSNKTHCPHGHEYTPENTALNTSSRPGKVGRICKTCKADEQRRRRERKRNG